MFKGADSLGHVLVDQCAVSTDAAFVPLSSGNSFTNLVSGTIALHSGADDVPLAGTTVYKKGSATGTTSGTVISLTNSSYWDQTGETFYNLLEHSASSQSGDSGGLVYNWYDYISYNAAGIVRGGANG